MLIKGRPISKKSHYRRSKSGRMYLTDTWKTWEKDALWQLKNYKEKHTGHVKIEYTFEIKGKYRVDLDNMVVAMNDILEAGEIIDNDDYIIYIGAHKLNGFKDWQTHISITPLTSSTTR